MVGAALLETRFKNEFTMSAEASPKPMLDVAFGIVLLGLLVGALTSGLHLGPVRPGWATIFLALYIQAWGGLFLLSYWFSEHSYLLGLLMWVCENRSNPRGAWTALLWGVFAIGMGSFPLLIGLGWIAP